MKALQNKINNWQIELDQEKTTLATYIEIYKATSAKIKDLSEVKRTASELMKKAGVFVEKEYAEKITITGTVNGLLPPSVRTQMAKEFATRKGIKFDHKEKTITKAIPTKL